MPDKKKHPSEDPWVFVGCFVNGALKGAARAFGRAMEGEEIKKVESTVKETKVNGPPTQGS